MKVGDRVRVIEAGDVFRRWFDVGAEGTVAYVVSDTCLDVRFDTGTFKKQFGETAVWSVLSSQVEEVIE